MYIVWSDSPSVRVFHQLRGSGLRQIILVLLSTRCVLLRGRAQTADGVARAGSESSTQHLAHNPRISHGKRILIWATTPYYERMRQEFFSFLGQPTNRKPCLCRVLRKDFPNAPSAYGDHHLVLASVCLCYTITRVLLLFGGLQRLQLAGQPGQALSPPPALRAGHLCI